VTDEAGTPVQGIKVSQKLIFLSADGKKDILGIDSILTDTSGRYQLNSYGSNNYKKLFVEDVDGEANGGEFLSDTLDIDFEKAVKTDDKYSYELNMDIKLKKK
jgi:putative lipoprotein (rSAM/lipoprotein system)